MTDAMIEKVHRLLEQHRVLILHPVDQKYRSPHRALVIGDSGVYDVVATPEGIDCPCAAHSRFGHCSHELAASVAWAER